jgi:polysaccharide pyruvyl transferase WcaK-like protein
VEAGFPLGYDTFYMIGADVVDGYYDAGTRLSLVETACLRGMDTRILGFSFNDNPHREAVLRLRRLAGRCQFFCRDDRSARRFEAHVGTCPILASDVAFLMPSASTLPEETAATLANHRRSGHALVLLNLRAAPQPGPHIARGNDELAPFVSELVATLHEFADRARFVVLPHDLRDPVGDEAACAALVQEMGTSACLISADSAKTVRTLCRHVDLVATCRLHLAISSFAAGTPCVMLRDQQAKSLGLFEQLEMGAFVAQSAVDWGTLLRRGLDDGAALRARIHSALPEVLRAAARNFA